MEITATSQINQGLERTAEGRDILCGANIIAEDVHAEASVALIALSNALKNENTEPDAFRQLIARARLAIVQLEIHHRCSYTVNLYVKEELERIGEISMPIQFQESDFPDVTFSCGLGGYWDGLTDKEQQKVFCSIAAHGRGCKK